MEDAGLDIERLETRLRAAEDVCVLVGWTGRGSTHHEKALHELWVKWMEVSGNNCTPEANPHLTDEFIAELAAKRDATRARTLAKIRQLPEVEG